MGDSKFFENKLDEVEEFTGFLNDRNRSGVGAILKSIYEEGFTDCANCKEAELADREQEPPQRDESRD